MDRRLLGEPARCSISGRVVTAGPLAGLALAAALWLLYLTPWGIGVGYDSYFYLTAADNLSRGLGLVWGVGQSLRPLIHYPPLYPALLSLAVMAGAEVAAAARGLGALLFGLNVFLAGYMVLRVTEQRGLAWLTSAVLGTSPVFLGVHLEAMTEPLFFLWLLMVWLVLLRWCKRGGTGLLVLAGAAAALAYLTRYIGASVFVAAFLFLLWRLRRLGLGARVRKLALFSGVALVFPLLWLLRNWVKAGSLTNRMLLFHPPSMQQLRAAVAEVSTWIAPQPVPLRLRLVFLALVSMGLAVSALWIVRQSRKGKEASVGTALSLLILFVAAYGLLLLTSLTFFDASTRLSRRILSPVYLASVLAAGMILAALMRNRRPGPGRVWLMLPLLVLIPINLWDVQNVAEVWRSEGVGFTSRRWRESEVVAMLRSVPRDVVLYSNEAMPLAYLLGRPVHSVPEKIDPVKAAPRPEFPRQMEQMRSTLRSEPSMLILMETVEREGLPSKAELADGLLLFFEGQDGLVFVAPEQYEAVRRRVKRD